MTVPKNQDTTNIMPVFVVARQNLFFLDSFVQFLHTFTENGISSRFAKGFQHIWQQKVFEFSFQQGELMNVANSWNIYTYSYQTLETGLQTLNEQRFDSFNPTRLDDISVVFVVWSVLLLASFMLLHIELCLKSAIYCGYEHVTNAFK